MSEFNPALAADKIRQFGKKYAIAKSQRIQLEQFRKSKKAILFTEALEGTVLSKESYAYAHADYIQLLGGLGAAVLVEEEYKYQLRALELRIEIWRTQSANNRKEVDAG